MPHYLSDTLVEDSEPEREARRQQRRIEKRRAQPPFKARQPPTVIDLDDEEDDAHAEVLIVASTLQAASTSIIDISDDSVSLASREEPPTSSSPVPVVVVESEESEIEVYTLPKPKPKRKPIVVPAYNPRVDDSAIFDDSISRPSFIIPYLPPTQQFASGTQPVEERTGSEAEDEPGGSGLNLAQFAFKRNKPARTRTEIIPASTSSKPAPRAKKQSERFVGEFSEAQLARLLKCVCCNLAWTARKSTAQKLVHLRSCAKKQGFTDDTVRVRLSQYLATLVDPDAPPDVTNVSETYFEEVVRDAAPKKRTRRKEVAGTVKAPEDTRASILRRAETLLQPGSEVGNGARDMPATQAFAPSRLAVDSDAESDDDVPAMPATQAFAPSRFGAVRGMVSSSSDEGPGVPSTQNFSPSRFGIRQMRPPSPPSPASYRNLQDSPAPNATKFHSSNAHAQTSLLISKSRKRVGSRSVSPEAPIEQDHIDDNEDVDAFLHFEPGEAIVPDVSPKPGRKKKGQDKGKGKGKVKDVTQTVAARWKEEEFDELWESDLKDKIQADKDLYYQILRYEPIHFDVFLAMATVVDRPVSGMLKYQVRLFLDKQAIIFYGGETSWRR